MFFLPDSAEVPVWQHFCTPVEEKLAVKQQNAGK
jgi:hypothetical protein